MIQVVRYTKEELLTLLNDILDEADVLEVSAPIRSLDQLSIFRNPEDEESE